MINVENIKKFKTKNKTVLIRFDLNVPLASGSPVSDRIIRVIDSIAELKLLNSKIVILSHLGRPKGKINNELSLKQITPQLEQAFNSKITFLDEITLFSLVNGFLPILLFLVLSEKVPNFEIFKILFFFKLSIIVSKKSSSKFSDKFLEKPICM